MNMMRRVILTWPLLAAALLLTAGCGGGFRTAYDAPVPAGTAQGWRLEDVTVNVPETLTVSEATAILPRAEGASSGGLADGLRLGARRPRPIYGHSELQRRLPAQHRPCFNK